MLPLQHNKARHALQDSEAQTLLTYVLTDWLTVWLMNHLESNIHLY